MRAAILFIIILIVILIFQWTSGVRVRVRLRTSRNALIQWQWGQGEGCLELVEVAYGQCLQGPPLSRLLRRGERKKTLRRSRSLHSVVYPADCSVNKQIRNSSQCLRACAWFAPRLAPRPGRQIFPRDTKTEQRSVQSRPCLIFSQ